MHGRKESRSIVSRPTPREGTKDEWMVLSAQAPMTRKQNCYSGAHYNHGEKERDNMKSKGAEADNTMRANGTNKIETSNCLHNFEGSGPAVQEYKQLSFPRRLPAPAANSSWSERARL